MNEYTIYLKNGVSFVVRCEKFTVTYSKYNGKVITYQYEHAESNIPLYIDVDDISAVIQKEKKTKTISSDGELINPDGHTVTERWP